MHVSLILASIVCAKTAVLPTRTAVDQEAQLRSQRRSDLRKYLCVEI
jgi:hypothetical protein